MIRLHPFLEKLFGLIELPEGLVEDVVARVKTRCANVDLKGCSRVQAQARLEIAACEAVLATFRDYHPRMTLRLRKRWPWAHVSLIGSSARVELWIGHDYDGDDLEPFDIVVDRRTKAVVTPRHEPELQLRKRAAALPPTQQVSRNKALLESRKPPR